METDIRLRASDLREAVRNGDHPAPPLEQGYKEACVFLLVSFEGDPFLLAILKSDTEGYPWRNQMALPGGHVDEEDPSPADAAYRELEEELNLGRGEVEMLGSMGHFQTINCRTIEVFVGVWSGNGRIECDPGEISKVFRIPLKELLAVHYQRSYHGHIPDIGELLYPYQDVTIWGATARIIHHFIELIVPCVEEVSA